MSTSEHANRSDLAEFMAGWDQRLRDNEQLPVWFSIIALTKFGDQPVPSADLAKLLGLNVNEVEARARGHCTSGAHVEDGFIRVDDGFVTYSNPERSEPDARRQLRIGDDRFGMIGCGFDVFLYAPLVSPSIRVEEICTVTGTPIQLSFSPDRVLSVEPEGAVVPIPGPQEFDRLSALTVQDVDANCATSPFFSSAAAAHQWLAKHPGGEVFPIRAAWDLSFHKLWRERMSHIRLLDGRR